MSTRIYLVKPKNTSGDEAELSRLVRASSAAHALRHVANDFSVTVPTQDELLAASAAGVQVEQATTTAAQEPAA